MFLITRGHLVVKCVLQSLVVVIFYFFWLEEHKCSVNDQHEDNITNVERVSLLTKMQIEVPNEFSGKHVLWRKIQVGQVENLKINSGKFKKKMLS